MHQRGTLTTIESGPGLYPGSVLTCHSHRQEPLELICESCDLLCCNSCHLSTHKNHRLVHIGKALQDQQWLFESLVAQVDERRSAVENTAKQIEDRLHGIKIMHRKAENQIKMAKMIMMNELNKRAHLLIEQLEKITEDFQRSLEDQLQGAIETCGQLDHVQRFITWATTQHGTSPVLFSKELISHQMQQLFESSFHQDSWVPVKIKFNWDASYWTKQISTLGELAVEGGDCSYPEGLACPDILKSQPIACLSLPSMCHRGSGQGCGYQACCHPQICCMHCIPSKTDMANLEQSQLEAVPYSSNCAQPALLQSQQIQRCCGPASPTLMHSAIQCPAPSQALTNQLGSNHGSLSRPATPQPQPKPHHRQCRVEQYSDCQAQPTADSERAGQGQCQGKAMACKAAQAQRHDQTATDQEITTNEESWEPRWIDELSLGHTPLVESRDAVGRVSQQGRRDYISLEQQQMFHISPAAELRREQQGSRLSLPHTDYRNRRTRSTSLEVSAHDVQSGSSSVCGRRKNRSQSIPAELAAPSTSPPAAERPAGSAYTYSLDQHDIVDARQRRASDGVIQCAARETSTAFPPLRGQSTMHLHPPSPFVTYKTESDNAYGYTTEEVTKEKYRAQRNSQKTREVQKEAGSPRVPMVCLERLKVLVSRLPPHGRRQSDPLPASGLETSGAVLQHRTWRNGMTKGMADGSDTMRPILSHITPPYTSEQRSPRQSTTPPVICELHSQGKGSQSAAATDPKHEPQRYAAAPDLDSDSEPTSGSEELELISEPDLDSEPHSDTPPESDQHPESSSDTEGESMTKGESVAEMGLCGKANILRLSEPRAEYEPDPESDTGMYSDNGEELDADVESGDAEAESDIQPDSDPSLEAHSDILSDQAPDSEPDIESEPELTTDEPQPLRSTTTDTDDPQPLRCDQQEGPTIGPGHRPLLIANSCPPRVSERPVDAQPDQGNTEMESEDYCAVCLIGGDLLCCDRCPKVFHLSCHIPPLRCFPTGDWICTLCRDVMRPEVDYDCENEQTSGHHASSARGLSTCDQRKCERLTLLIFSNILSAPFHEPVSPLAQHYYQIIKRPMDLSVIRAKLNKRNTRRYYSTEEYVADVYLMFRNCAKFNYPDSEVAQAGHSLEAFFNSKLKEVFPDKVFPMAEEEPDSDEYDEAYRATENGFPMPDRTEQCHRKRKRRHSVNSKRHQL